MQLESHTCTGTRTCSAIEKPFLFLCQLKNINAHGDAARIGHNIRISRNRTPQTEHPKLRVLDLKNMGKPTCDFEIDLFQDDTNRIQYLATSTRHTRMIPLPL